MCRKLSHSFHLPLIYLYMSLYHQLPEESVCLEALGQDGGVLDRRCFWAADWNSIRVASGLERANGKAAGVSPTTLPPSLRHCLILHSRPDTNYPSKALVEGQVFVS